MTERTHDAKRDARTLAVLWLRDEVKELRRKATEMDHAYTTKAYTDACKYVAAQYRKAADGLDEAARDVEMSTGWQKP